MKNHITAFAGAMIIVITVFGCSNSSKVTAPQATHTRTSNTPQESARLSINYPNPVTGILGTSPEGCHIVYIDQKHFVVLDIDTQDVPFQLVDGMRLTVNGQYLSYHYNPCGGPVFEVTFMRSLEPTGKSPNIPNNGFGQ